MLLNGRYLKLAKLVIWLFFFFPFVFQHSFLHSFTLLYIIPFFIRYKLVLDYATLGAGNRGASRP